MSERVRFRPIGETFVDGQGRTLQVQETKFPTCEGCVNYLNRLTLVSCFRLKNYTGNCSEFGRGDRKNVIFVEVKGGKQ